MSASMLNSFRADNSFVDAHPRGILRLAIISWGPCPSRVRVPCLSVPMFAVHLFIFESLDMKPLSLAPPLFSASFRWFPPPLCSRGNDLLVCSSSSKLEESLVGLQGPSGSRLL